MNPDKLPLSMRIARRFSSQTLRHYSACKLASDPVYRAVAQRLHPINLPLLDIGCGIGLCPFYLRECGYTGPIWGVDFDGRKIAAAQEHAARHYEGITFDVGSAEDPDIFAPLRERVGHVVMLDVLHYFKIETQQVVLRRIAEAVAPGGWAILRATPRDTSWRFRCTAAEEWLIQRIGWMKRAPVRFPTVEQITAPFEQAGFSAEVRPLWGKTPFNSHLFAFQRT